MRPAMAETLRGVLGFVVASAARQPFDSTPIVGPVRKMGRKLGMTEPDILLCLEGPCAAENLGEMCMKAIKAGGIDGKVLLRLLCMVNWPHASVAPVEARDVQPDQASFLGYTPAIETQNVDPSPIVSPHAVKEQRLDEQSRRRALTMLRFLAVVDCLSLRMSPEAANAHVARTVDILNLKGVRDAPITLAWNHPVCVSPDGASVLYDHKMAVLAGAHESYLSMFGLDAANTVECQPIPRCAATISEVTSDRGVHRMAIMRQVEELYKMTRSKK